RLERYGVSLERPEARFGDRVLPAVDPHGLRIALIEPATAAPRRFTPWDGGPVPGERQVRGLHGARLWERDAAPSAAFLTRVLGVRRLGGESEWTRYGFDD